jgi:pimeloyl-ACP methyl ester carboxylesterase
MDAAGSQCAEVRVPIDYRHPHGRTIAIAVSRLPARDPVHRRGTLLFNPGGPGDPAFGLSLGFAAGAPDLAAAYDLVDVDPRFVGRSAGFACRWTTDISLRGAGPTRRTFAESVAFARDLARGCDSDLLPYASTRNTARDLDAVRAALGVSKVSYVGWSYGSYLGARIHADVPEPGRPVRARQRRRPGRLRSPADPDDGGGHRGGAPELGGLGGGP